MIRFILSLAFVAFLVAGCGGGGGHDKPPTTLEGVANLHEDTLRPRIGVVEPWEDTLRSVEGCSVRTSVVPSGHDWQDVNWMGLPLPPVVYGKRYYIAGYNDTDNNGAYRTEEALGFFGGYLVYYTYNGSTDWWIVYDNGQIIRALECRNASIYISGQYVRSTLNVAQSKEEAKEKAFLEKVQPK